VRELLDGDPAFRTQYASLAAAADVLVQSSHAGFDAQLHEQLGVRAAYVPNAAGGTDPEGDFRAPHLNGYTGPLLLAVGNLWPEKNHLALLDALREHPGEFRLAIVGRPDPGHLPLAAEIERRAALDPRVTLVPGVAPEMVASAMRQADLLLLPSAADATPLVLLEAMRFGLPWLATANCGSAHDHAGGAILPVESFPGAIDHLLADGDARAALGAEGRSHFELAYSWDVVGAAYSALLSGAAPAPAPAPEAALVVTDRIRAGIYDSLRARRAAGAVTTGSVPILEGVPA
jgi:glycosyltransferase involved in cell wall biosynthesis